MILTRLTQIFEMGSTIMYGAILGDIAGSRIEFGRPKNFDAKSAELFCGGCAYTDDTVLTVATKYALLNHISYAKAYGKFGRKYRGVGFGPMFQRWLDTHSEKGYNSYGNGAAMRVSFIGEYFNTLEEVEDEAEKSAVCTHNHHEGAKAAVATAGTVFLARNGASKKEIAKYLHKKFGYPVKKPLAFYRPFSKFDPTAEATMPLAIRCFLESDDWESCIRNVFSLQCDADTVGCIAGGMAEAFYKGTGMKDEEILRSYLIRPDRFGIFDDFLYKCAIAPVPSQEEEKPAEENSRGGEHIQ